MCVWLGSNSLSFRELSTKATKHHLAPWCAYCVCLICMPYMYTFHLTLYVCFICIPSTSPYMYALYVYLPPRLTCMPYMYAFHLALYVPYMYALYAYPPPRLTCMFYMYTFHLASSAYIHLCVQNIHASTCKIPIACLSPSGSSPWVLDYTLRRVRGERIMYRNSCRITNWNRFRTCVVARVQCHYSREPASHSPSELAAQRNAKGAHDLVSF